MLTMACNSECLWKWQIQALSGQKQTGMKIVTKTEEQKPMEREDTEESIQDQNYLL